MKYSTVAVDLTTAFINKNSVSLSILNADSASTAGDFSGTSLGSQYVAFADNKITISPQSVKLAYYVFGLGATGANSLTVVGLPMVASNKATFYESYAISTTTVSSLTVTEVGNTIYSVIIRTASKMSAGQLCRANVASPIYLY